MTTTLSRYRQRGGRNDLRNQLYNSRSWKRLRLEVIARDGGCTGPGPHEGRLTVHHIVPILERPDLARDEANLTTKCRACHGRLDGGRATKGGRSTRLTGGADSAGSRFSPRSKKSRSW